MSKPNGKKMRGAMSAILGVLDDKQWHNGAELERAGGNRYSSRINDLRDLGYLFETRSAPQGSFDDYRLIGLGDPRHSTTVRVDLSLEVLRDLFVKKQTASLKHVLVDAHARAESKYEAARAYQEKLRDSEMTLLDFFASLDLGT